jgi:hypothetical protein
MSADWFGTLINNKKFTYAALSAIVFMTVSLPQTYQKVETFSNKGLSYLPGSMSINTINNNCPTPAGKFVHTGVFFVVLYFLMKWLNKSDLSDGLIAKYSFYTTLIFFLLSSNDSYALTSQIPSMEDLVDDSGCPTKKGVLVHGLVFLVILALVMYFPKDE